MSNRRWLWAQSRNARNEELMPEDEDTLPLPPTPAPDGKPHVYVINSDPTFLEMIADLLADTRAHVTLEAMRPNIEVTLDNLRSARPDLLLLDVVPFRNDAEPLLERMEADDELRHVPVMVASTSPKAAEAAANAHAALVRDILPKPFDLGDFYAKLEGLVAGIQVR
jgi:DNA-binding response OmpR family regulator